jgi:hypothetical protein
MRTGIILSAIALALGACAGEPVYKPPADQTVRDYRDTWQYVTDRYVIYRSRMDDYLLEFKGSCDRLTDNSALPPADVIHDHRNLRASDTFRGCIVEKLYAISNDQRVELRNLGHSPGQND